MECKFDMAVLFTINKYHRYVCGAIQNNSPMFFFFNAETCPQLPYVFPLI